MQSTAEVIQQIEAMLAVAEQDVVNLKKVLAIFKRPSATPLTVPKPRKVSHHKKRKGGRKYQHPRIAKRNMRAAGQRMWAALSPSERKARVEKMQKARWAGRRT